MENIPNSEIRNYFFIFFCGKSFAVLFQFSVILNRSFFKPYWPELLSEYFTSFIKLIPTKC